MNFEMLDKLTDKEAKELLREFLEEENRLAHTTFEVARQDGVQCDFSLASLSGFLRWVLHHLETVPKEPDPTVSEWIRSTEDYRKGLFDFVDESKNLVVRASYYLGECFVRNFATLQWGVGNPDYAFKNMPVVTGFLHEKELPPLLVLNNLFRQIIKSPTKESNVEIMIASWCRSIPG